MGSLKDLINQNAEAVSSKWFTFYEGVNLEIAFLSGGKYERIQKKHRKGSGKVDGEAVIKDVNQTALLNWKITLEGLKYILMNVPMEAVIEATGVSDKDAEVNIDKPTMHGLLLSNWDLSNYVFEHATNRQTYSEDINDEEEQEKN